MSDGLNRVTLLGNVGSSELRFTVGGQAILNIRMATSDSFLDKDRVRQERTEWHSVTVWGKRGEALGAILAKGMKIYVDGALRTHSYDDKDGVKRYKTEINAEEIILCGDKREAQAPREGTTVRDDRPAGGSRKPTLEPAPMPIHDEDIPF